MKINVYLYANIKGSSIPQPIELIPDDKFTSQILKFQVCIDDIVFYNQYAVIKSSNSITLKIGESFTIKIIDKQPGCKVNYKTSTKARVLAKDLEFLLAFIDRGYCSVNGGIIPFDYENADFSNFNKENEIERLEFAKRTVKVLDLLNCHDDIDLSTLTDEETRHINRLAIALIDKKTVHGLRDNLPAITAMKVGNLRFAIFLEKQNDENGTYRMFDFFKSEHNVAYKNVNGEMCPTSQYSILKSDDLLNLSNLRPEVLLPSFQKVKERKGYERDNWFLLELLLAYDKSNGKRIDLLTVAYDFSIWLRNVADDLDSEIKELNYLQVVKRQRTLNLMEVGMLWNMADNTSVADIYKVAVYLLLDQQVPAERYFKKLSAKDQNDFKNLPIYHFWNKKDE